MNKNLTELLQKKQKSASGVAIDWDDRRNKYLVAVNELYDQIRSILAEPIHQHAVSVRSHPKKLSEDYIGTYSVDDLVLSIGDEQVRFSPRGRNTAGVAGRVDVVGERAEAILIYQPESGWAFVKTRQPSVRTEPFNEATLTEVFQLVMRA